MMLMLMYIWSEVLNSKTAIALDIRQFVVLIFVHMQSDVRSLFLVFMLLLFRFLLHFQCDSISLPRSLFILLLFHCLLFNV